MIRAQRQDGNIGDCGYNDRSTLVKTGKWSDGEQRVVECGDRWCKRSVRRWNDGIIVQYFKM